MATVTISIDEDLVAVIDDFCKGKIPRRKRSAQIEADLLTIYGELVEAYRAKRGSKKSTAKRTDEAKATV